MKKSIFSFLILCLISTPAFAYNPLETTDHANQRHQAERYQAQEDNSGNPLYQSQGTFGDPGGDSNYRYNSSY